MGNDSTSGLIIGKVMHRRELPLTHAFTYPVVYLQLDIDEAVSAGTLLFGRNRRRLFAFNDADHGDGGAPRAWINELLAQHGLSACHGRLVVQTFPRFLGYVFNPVSFWYCHRRDTSVAAIVAEVNNTFGERHYYVIRPNQLTGRFQDICLDKNFFVSPFFPVSGEYRFTFNLDYQKPSVAIDYHNQNRLQFRSAIFGKVQPLTALSLLRAAVMQPFFTLNVTFRIHWQALRLWLKGVKLVDRSTQTLRDKQT